MKNALMGKPWTKSLLPSLSISALILVAPAAQAANVWDMPTPYPEAEFHTKNVNLFANDLVRRSNGQIKIKVHSAQSLFKHPEIKRAVRTGQVPIGELLMANMQNDDAIFGADVVPFLATSHQQAMALYRAQRPHVEKRLKKRGMRLLYAVPWPGQGFYTKRTITRVADLQGVKFRTYNAATARLADLMGAVPTIVEVVEIPQAFATGIVDAMVTSGATGVRAKAWDFVQHFYDLNAWLPKNMVLGTLSVRVADIFTLSISIWKTDDTTWATLTNSPCPISVPPWFRCTLPSV
jgi:TRAP-type C4-dicarboxylate transport system substrate-binding protein